LRGDGGSTASFLGTKGRSGCGFTGAGAAVTGTGGLTCRGSDSRAVPVGFGFTGRPWKGPVAGTAASGAGTGRLFGGFGRGGVPTGLTRST